MKSKRESGQYRVFLTLIIAGGLISSCTNPIPEGLASQILDNDGPLVTIVSPADRSQYSTIVEVTGTVSDESGSTDHISGCEFSIAGTSIGGTFDLDGSGEFSFTFATRDSDGTLLLSGPATLEVCASDWNGNMGTATIQLIPTDSGDVPGFSIVPGDKQATITWDEIPGTESYDLLEYKYGEIKEKVTSPYIWRSLENGEVYAFELTANVPEGTGGCSGFREDRDDAHVCPLFRSVD